MVEPKTSCGMGRGGRRALQTQGRPPPAWSKFFRCRPASGEDRFISFSKN